jgi:hypothetical protein
VTTHQQGRAFRSVGARARKIKPHPFPLLRPF